MSFSNVIFFINSCFKEVYFPGNTKAGLDSKSRDVGPGSSTIQVTYPVCLHLCFLITRNAHFSFSDCSELSTIQEKPLRYDKSMYYNVK